MTSALPQNDRDGDPQDERVTVRRGRASPAGTSVVKTVRILEALAAAGGPHRLMDVAARAAVPRSTAYRVLNMLAAEGFVENFGEGRYGVGGRAGALGAQLVSVVSAGVGPALRRLRTAAGGNTVHLAVRVGDHAVYLHKVDSDKPYEMRSRVGDQLWLHCTAIGKAILAHLPADEVAAVARTAGLPSRTAATVTELPALHSEIAAVRGRGYAIDDEENEETVRCLGAAIVDRSGRATGGVSISTVTFAVDRDELLGYAPALRATVHGLTDLIQPAERPR